MKIDLHNHTTLGSECSIISPADLMAEAMVAGLDGVAITEHDNLDSADAVRRLGKRAGLRVFVGIECWTQEGHVLAYGVRPPYLDGPRPVSLRRAIDWIHGQGGIAVIAHPFRRDNVSPADRLGDLIEMFDAIEIYNAHNADHENEPAIEAARRFGLPAVAGSDTHCAGSVGQAYTIFQDDIEDDAALADAIRRGACTVAWTADGVRP